MRKMLLWTLLGGMVYFAIEGLWRLPAGGWANVSMLFVGGLCFTLIGGINQIPAFFYLSMRKQAAIGTVIVLVVEYAAGWLLNIKLGMGIWDYTHLPLNLNGQICVLFAGLWFLLMPFAIWLEDRLNLFVWLYVSHRGRPAWINVWDYSLRQAYKELFLV